MKYDIAILGGGPAGYSAAFEAVKNGLSVVLFEGNYVGGTCLNRGCIPTKFLVHTSDIFYSMMYSSRFGIKSTFSSINFQTMYSEMNSTVEKLRNELTAQLLSQKVVIISGDAKLLKSKVVICNDIEYHAKNILLATGSVAAKPIIEGALTSDEFLKLDYIPKSVKIIGGGVIAIEFANILNRLNSDVTINIRGERILRKWDKELANSITQNFKKSGIKIKTKCSIEDFEEGAYDVILSALGRIPRTDAFSEVDVALDDKGAVIADDNGQTNVDGVYAAGDVVSGSTMLAHTAMEQGRRVVQHIVGKRDILPSVVSNCIYVSPEVASIGVTEYEAKEKGIDFVSAKINMMSNAMTLIHTEKRSFLKVLAKKDTHEIIGAQLMCERASDLSSEFVVAINNRLTVENIKSSLHPHPSFSEAIYDVMTKLEDKLNEV